MADPILQLNDVRTHFPVHEGFLVKRHAGTVKAVDGVTLSLMPGEVLGLVGESGCGKSTLARTIMQLIPATGGSVVLEGRNLTAGSTEEVRAVRRDLQMVFQDPFASLNPRLTAFAAIAEPLVVHRTCPSDQVAQRVAELMTLVGLSPRYMQRYPHEFSGGQRQRIAIARALALDPDVLVADEAVSALDVSVQAQVLNLLKDLQAEMGLTYLFIAHNLAVVNYMAERVAVMAAGRIVEIGPCRSIFNAPAHPYTRALLKAVPFADLDRPLVLDELVLRGSSDPRNWPGAFQGDMDDLATIDLGCGHEVLARPEVDFREVRA